MAGFYKGTIPIIDDTTDEAFFRPAGVGFGAVPRDFEEAPEHCYGSSPSEMSLYPESEWDALYDEEEATKSSLEHLYLPEPNKPRFVNLDQNGFGDCWAYSTGHAIMFDRLKQNLPLVRLNPGATAVLTGRLDGGWCGLSLKFSREVGYAEEGTGPGQWPLYYRGRDRDTPELRASMARYKVTEDWYDLTKQVWDQKLARRQVATCLFNNLPTPGDFNWWGHSVLQIRWVRIERGSWGPLIFNSWKGWGRHGLAVLQGSKATCNNAVSVRTTVPSSSLAA